MGKITKRAGSLLLALLMVLGCVWSAFTVTAASDQLFKDDFSSSALSGWGSASVGGVQGGQYVINGTGSNGVATLGAVKDVAVLADVKVESGKDANGKVFASGMSSILFHASEDLSTGYEFGIGLSKNGTTYAILYRTVAGTTEILNRRTTKVPGTEAGKVVAGKSYALKVIMEGNTFGCYINDELFYEYTDNSLTKGVVGVAVWNAKGTFDNFAVHEVGNRTLEGIQLENTPAQITVAGDFDLDIIAKYSGVFGSRKLNVNSPGVKITGIDGNTGPKTLTVSYGGKSATFTTNVVPSKDGTVLYEDGFDSADGWNTPVGTMVGDKPFQFLVENGRLVGKMPAYAGFDKPASATATFKNTATLLTDAYYSVHVDAVITGDSTAKTFREGIAEMYVALIGGVEYRFRITSSGHARLYAGSTLKAEAVTADVVSNKTAKMRVDVRGNNLACYVNDVLVINYKDNSKEVSPLVRLAVHNGSATFDNFKITDLEAKSKWAVRRVDILNADGKVTNTYTGYDFDITALNLQLSYYDGSTAVESITEDMISGFDSSSRKKQNVKVVYGNHSKDLSIVFTDYIYYNDFSEGLKGIVDAKNNYAVCTVRNGRLVVQYTLPEDGRTVTKTLNIPGCDQYSNYSISADIILSEGNTRKSLYAGFGFRANGDGTSYIYRLEYSSSNKLILRLMHNVGNGNVELAKWSNTELLATFPLDAEYAVVDLNTSVNLKVDIIDNAIYCYFNNVLLGVVYDEVESYKQTNGEVYLQAINASAVFDNVYVAPLGKRTVTSISVSGDYAVDGALQVYQGWEVEPDITNITVNYNDGLKLTVPLWADYITENYDPNTLGKQQMTVSYMGGSAKVDVTVIDRPDYVAAFIAKVNAFKKGSLTTADQKAIGELKAYFGTLTPYEIQNLGGNVYKDYVDLINEMDLVKNEGLKELDLVYYNDFSKAEDISQWKLATSSGKVFARNGYMINEMKRYGESGASLYYDPTSYSEIKSVEADVMLLYPSTFAALTVYAHNANYYHLRVTNKYTDENNQKIYTVQLYKYNGSQLKLVQIYPILRGVEVQEGKWNNLRMLMDNGLLTVYMDDVLLFQHDDSNTNDYITDGYVAFRTAENDARYDNFKVYGTKKEIPKVEYEKQITPTEYTDDFEDETVGKNPSHWVEDNETDDWKVMNKGGSKVYGATAKSKPVYTWLHAFEEDPVYKLKFLSTAKNSGKVGFITRMFDEDGYMAIGYNYAEQKWFIAGTMSKIADDQLIYAQESTPLAAGEWHDVEINLQGTNISVLVDGKEVLNEKELLCIGFGRMGLFADGADMYVDNVYVKSVNGTNFDNGVVEYTLDDDTYLNSMGIQDLGGDVIFGCHGSNAFISYDNGQTFTRVTKDNPYYAAVIDGGSGYVTYFEIGKNRFLKVVGDTTVYESTDGMLSWKEVGRVVPESEDNYDAVSGAWLPIFHTGSMTKIEMPNGTTRLFMPIAVRTVNQSGGVLGHYSRFYYSDDWGRTWTESENDTRDIIPSYNNNTTITWAEGKIIKCADGTIRFYQTRNKNGCTVYLESKDYGVTWTEFGRIPYMQCPMGSFGIEEDPTAPGTYYMAYVNGAGRTFGGVFPRVRLTLVKTTDGKNWEFVTDVERTTDYAAGGTTDIRQFLDPDVCVTEDYIFVTYGRCNDYDNTTGGHNNQRARFVRFDRKNLSTRPWDDATMHDSTYIESIEIAKLPQTKFGYGDLFNTTGLEIQLNAINGMKFTEGPKEFYLVDGEPNMFKLGKQTVTLLSKHYCYAEYEIEIVPNYDLIWTIKGKGSIDPNPEALSRLMEGANQTFTLKPAKGYKVGSVTVNGKAAKVTKKTFTIENVQENQEIEVRFVKLGFIDYLPYILIGIVVVAGIAVGAIFLIKKQKKSAAAKENIDISSHSAPTDDQE